MIVEFVNRGVCSRKTIIDISQDGTINDISIVGGCAGNTRGIMTLLKGMNARDVIKKLRGIDCGGRGTSCPDQVAQALESALEKLG